MSAHSQEPARPPTVQGAAPKMRLKRWSSGSGEGDRSRARPWDSGACDVLARLLLIVFFVIFVCFVALFLSCQQTLENWSAQKLVWWNTLKGKRRQLPVCHADMYRELLKPGLLN